MDILGYIVNIIGSFSLAEKIAFLAFLVSALSAYNSSRAIRISQQTEKRIEKSEKLSKSLKLKEKKSEGTRLLNEALMKLTQSKTSIELCQLSFGSLLDLSSEHISETSKNKFEMDYEKTLKAIKDIEKEISEIELKIRDVHETIKEETDLLDIDEKLLRADSLDKEATMEFQKIQGMHQDILEGVKTFRKVTFKKHGIDI